MKDMNLDPKQLSPEEQLDLLLEQFLNDPNDEVPTFADVEEPAVSEEAPEPVETPLEEEPAAPASPEDQLDSLLSSLQEMPDEPVPVDTAAEESQEIPAVLSFWDICPEDNASAEEAAADVPEETPEEEQAEEAEPLPVILPMPELATDEDDSSDDEPMEEAEEEQAEEAEQPPVILPMPELIPDEDTSSDDEPIEESEEEPAEEAEQPPVILPMPELIPDGDAASDDEPIEETEDAPIEESEEEPAEEAEQPPVILPMPELTPDEDTPVSEEPIEETEAAKEAPAEEPVLDVTPAETESSEEATQEPPTEESQPEEDAAPADAQEDDDAALALAVDQAIERILEEAMQEQEAEASAEETATEEAEAPQEEAAPEQEEPTPAEEAPVPAIIPEEEKPMPKEEVTPEPEEKEEKANEKPVPPKKRRPKNTKAYGFFGIPHLVATAVWLGIILFIGVGLGKFVWNCAADVLALGKPNSEVIITVTEDDDLDSLAQKLKATGLINYPSLFKIYGNISEAMDTIRTGTFKLNTQFDYHALVDAMSSNQRRETTNVTIPEGYTCAQIFRLLENKGVCSIDKLEAAAATGDLGDYWFLEGLERGSANCLEGFMFPDTYTFYLDHDPVGVIRKFLDNFNKRFNDKMKIKLDTLNMTLGEMMRQNGLSEDYIAAHQLMVRDVVIIASMIEKETASNPESYNISSVIYNRLTNPNEFPCLQIDATIVYYTGRVTITAEDLATDHPYNSYTRPGLVAGPISNPGAYSLDAALDPVESEFYFYALDPSTGAHHFSKTLKEHEDFLNSIRKDETEEEPEEEPAE